MYYPFGLPKYLAFPQATNEDIRGIACNRDRILFAVLLENALWIWYSRPCVPLVSFKRSLKSVLESGNNNLVEWRPDSSMLVIATTKNVLLFYSITADTSVGESYDQLDSAQPGLKRCSAELYSKENIPNFSIAQLYRLDLIGQVTCLVCLRDELMVATVNGHLQRVKWDGTMNYDYCIDLSRVPFCDDQLVMKAVPLEVPGTGVHPTSIEYSPLVGGFACVLSDGRAAFLTASTLKFDPNAVQGIWAREVDDACCTAINHKYRLLAFGKSNSEGIVMSVDEATGGLETCHRLSLSSKDFAGDPGPVGCMRWTPDGTALALCWKGGGFSLWSVFGSLLSASLKWDYSDHPLSRPLTLKCLEWGAEGYEAWCVGSSHSPGDLSYRGKSAVSLPPFEPRGGVGDSAPGSSQQHTDDGCGRGSLFQMTFVKSALTVNPCMSRLERVLLQGSDRLYLSPKECVEGVNDDCQLPQGPYFYPADEDDELFDEAAEAPFSKCQKQTAFHGAANKQWLVVHIPYTYTASNWPIRYTCVDDEGQYIGAAGRNGAAHYDLLTRRWRLFGNENQEEDLVVTGGLMWWRNSHLVLGAYSIPTNSDQVRFYPRTQKLDDEFAVIVPQSAQVLLLNIYCDQMIVLTADCRMTVYNISETSSTFKGGFNSVVVSRIQEVDISGLTVHPACVASVALTSLRTESWRAQSPRPVRPPAQSIIFNIAGKVLMIQRDRNAGHAPHTKDQKLFESAQMTPIVLASCCESLWVSTRTVGHKPHLSHALWLHCGAQGTRAWLPLFPSPDQERGHAFMARRIMLPFTPSIYPLAVMFNDAIMVGAETDSSVLACDSSTKHQPLVFVEKTSQVYLHHLLRQLLRRNLGYHAWEVANTCRNLPYFPHSLELLLHQVLEEEATSKDPLPDSLLPRVLDFIREFPVHLLTVVQCARKTELALWRYLFSVAGSPRHLFTQALNQAELDTAASYLIILQNLESASVSRAYATKLLDAALEASKWELSKDLIRFLRAIDPTDLHLPKPSPPTNVGTRLGFSLAASPPVSPQCADEDLSMIMPNTKALRGRSFSSASAAKSSGPAAGSPESTGSPFPHMLALRTPSGESAKGGPGPVTHEGVGPRAGPDARKSSAGSSKDVRSPDRDFLDVIVQKRAKKLLLDVRLRDLGTMAAHLDFPLVSWLSQERLRAAAVDDFVATLRLVHHDFAWPFPSGAPGPGHGSGPPSASSNSSRLSSMHEKLHHLTISSDKPCSMSNAEFADSGYLSQCTQPDDPPSIAAGPASPLDDAVTQAAMLVPRHTMPANGDSMSLLSEEASLFDNYSPSLSGGVEWGSEGLADPARLLIRSPDIHTHPQPKPPPYAEVQLRYLLQIFLEARCLEMSAILAVVLRDASAVLRVAALGRSADTPALALKRLASGLAALSAFANTQCLGYQSFLLSLSGEVSALQDLWEQRGGPGLGSSPGTSPAMGPVPDAVPGSSGVARGALVPLATPGPRPGPRTVLYETAKNNGSHAPLNQAISRRASNSAHSPRPAERASPVASPQQSAASENSVCAVS